MMAHYLLTALQWTCVILGIGGVITLHEWGHFIVAKLCRVRVERFSIGFGPALCRWRRGETEYWISWVPLGGYVKMTGENPDGQDSDDPRAFHMQSASRRAAIALAGITMNLLTAFALFTVAFQIGASFPGPEIGGVEEPSPAWAAGLRAGDVIRSIGGVPVVGFADIAETIAHNDTEDGILIEFERQGRLTPDGARLLLEEGVWNDAGDLLRWRAGAPWTPPLGIAPGDEVTGGEVRSRLELAAASADGTEFAFRGRLPIVPERNETLGFQTIGIAATSDLRVAKLISENGSAPALEAGILPADRIVAVDGTALSSWEEFTEYVRARPGTTIRIDLERGGEKRTVEAIPRPHHSWRIGVELGGPSSEIAHVRPGSLADRIGLRRGDRFVESPLGSGDPDGTPVEARARWQAPEPALLIQRVGGEARVTLPSADGSGPTPPWEDVIEGILWAPTVSGVAAGGAAEQAGLQPGDRIERAWIGSEENPVPVRLWSDIPAIVSASAGENLRLEVTRGSGRATVEMHARLDERNPTGALGILPADRLVTQRIANPWRAFLFGVRRCWIEIQKIPRFLGRLVDRSERAIDVKNLAGPIAIAQVASRFADWGVGSFIYFFGFVSVQLAVLNLLPIPVLDGGHLLYIALEKIKGGRLSDRAQAIGQYIGLALLLPLMALVFYNDIARLISRLLGGS
ncbi:MAG: site-2 protease family protein [Planctomycetes bacterium]|nr:site-2 protease family protein [Planctomycetota bacterium]